MQAQFQNVGVVGAGVMGRGIVQMAVQAGSRVRVFDQRPGEATAACEAVADIWAQQVAKGRLQTAQQAAYRARLTNVTAVQELASCDLVIEAVVERLDIKQALLAELEHVVPPKTVLATNTSSLSVTAIGAALQHPERLTGYHFFNPVPAMRVVEVIAGLLTDPVVCQYLMAFTKAFGHVPVSAQDTPGFIVNHAGRGYGTEALRLASERVSDFATIDRILTDQMGFKLGPFELMDLTGMDVSHPVMETIYRQYYDEPRYRPSVIAGQRLAGGLLGRKVGEGFYRYQDGVALVPPEPVAPAIVHLPPVWVSPKAARRAELYQLLKTLGASIETAQVPSSAALIVVAPMGLDVTTLAAVERLDPSRIIVHRHDARRRQHTPARAGHQSRLAGRHARGRPCPVRPLRAMLPGPGPNVSMVCAAHGKNPTIHLRRKGPQ